MDDCTLLECTCVRGERLYFLTSGGRGITAVRE